MTTCIQNMVAALIILEADAAARNTSMDYRNALTAARSALEIAVEVGEGAAR